MISHFHASVQQIADAVCSGGDSHAGWLPQRDKLGRDAHNSFYLLNPSGIKEYGVSADFVSDDADRLTIQGRIDLLETAADVAGNDQKAAAGGSGGGISANAVRITEFKSLILPSGSLPGIDFHPPERFALQVQIYAYLVYRLIRDQMIAEFETVENPAEIKCRLALNNLKDGSLFFESVEWNLRDIETKLTEYIDLCKHRAATESANRLRRKSIAEKVVFPFPSFRRGQKETIALLEEALSGGKDVLLSAVPGFGKTAAVMFPAIKRSLETGKQLFFATAKGGGRSPVYNTIRRFQKKCAELKVLFLYARNELCPKDAPATGCKDCEFERLERYDSGRFDLPEELIRLNLVRKNELQAIAKKHSLCPVDLSFILTRTADMVIGDYNYVFDPSVQLMQFRDAHHRRDVTNWLLLIDEAHNLFDRGMNMHSARIELNKAQDCRYLLRRDEWNYSGGSAYVEMDETLSRIISLLEWRIANSPPGKYVIQEIEDSELENIHEELGEVVSRFLIESNDADVQLVDSLFELYSGFKLLSGLLSQERRQFPFYVDTEQGAIGVDCLDPSERLAGAIESFESAIAFSGAFHPLPFYKYALGFGSREVSELDVEDQVHNGGLKVVLAAGVDTRYRLRPRKAEAIAGVLRQFCSLRTGTYLAIFPSYEFLDLVKDYLPGGDMEVIFQYKYMRSDERAAFRKKILHGEGALLALIVAGGQFSEAADYPGSACIGAAIVGPCLPPPDERREALRSYWDSRQEDGEMTAYLIPAMHRVIQAAGRVIRSEEDRGVVLLLDDRFMEPRYAKLLPSRWQSDLEGQNRDWEQVVREFWDS